MCLFQGRALWIGVACVDVTFVSLSRQFSAVFWKVFRKVKKVNLVPKENGFCYDFFLSPLVRVTPNIQPSRCRQYSKAFWDAGLVRQLHCHMSRRTTSLP